MADRTWRSVTTHLSPDEREELDGECRRRGITVYRALREAIRAWLDDRSRRPEDERREG